MGRGAEGVLGLKDVGWEMHFEDFETSAIVAWVRGLGGSTFSLRGAYGGHMGGIWAWDTQRAWEHLRNMGM